VTASPPTHLSESLHRVSAIDALRGLAALLVLFYHARGMFWIGFSQTWHQYGLHPDFNALLGYLSVPLSYGSLGVTLFFVLSGYCIHRRGAGQLVVNPRATIDLKAFAVRRFWRIYPTYLCALLITALIDGWILARTGIRDPAQDDSLHAFLVSLVTLQGYLAVYFGSNGVFWTLAMEVHLYLAYPILFYLSKRVGPRKTLLFTLAIGLAYLAANALCDIDRYLPYRFSRGPIFLPFWFTWAMGFFIAETEAGRTADLGQAAWRVLMTSGLFFGLLCSTFNWLGLAEFFWALVFSGVLRWSLQMSGRKFWSQWFGTVLATVGVFSYSLYAIHAPLLEVFHVWITNGDSHKFATLWPAFGGIVFAVAGGWLFFQLVERWSIRPARTAAVKP
jgi:peptidoglycan/LPS O-acetylase OafA/YrhL